MTHLNDNVLGLTPLGTNNEWGFDPTRIVTDELAKSSEDIDAINTGTINQKVMIDAISSKARFGMRRLLEIDKFAGDTFNETVNSIMTINQEMHGTPCENYSTAFNDRLLKIASRHIFGLLEVSAMSIAKEVMRPMKPAPPKNFLGRLLSPGS